METVEKHARRDLTEGVVWKRLLLFFLPIAAGTCIQQLYNAADGLIVGRFVGTAALASVGGSSAQIINVLIGFFVALTAGASVVIAQIFGAGRREDIDSAVGNAVVGAAALGLVLAVLGQALAPWLLRLLRTPEDTVAGSLLYLRVYFIGVPFVLVLNMESNILRATGDSFSPFLFMAVCCLSNIVLDLLFVVVLGWGIAGVAAATVAAQVINMALLTRKLTGGNAPCRLVLRGLRMRAVYLSNMLRLGVPSGLQSSMYAVSNVIIQAGLNTLGTVVVASWAMSSKVDGVFWAVSNAFGAAVTSFIGQNIGAGKEDRVRKCVRQGLALALGITAVLCTAIMLAAKPLLGILTTDPDVVSTTYRILTFFVPYYCIWTFIEVISSTLRGAGDAVRPVVIIGLGICLFRVIWVATVFARFHTLRVLSFSYVTSWAVTAAALIIYYLRGRWMDRSRGIVEK